MIYLFTQDMKRCVPFSKDELIIVDNNIYVINHEGALASYNTYEDCIKVMNYLNKRIRLNCSEFIFPPQECVDIMVK